MGNIDGVLLIRPRSLEVVYGNNMKPLVEDAALKKWNIEVGKAIFAIKSTIEKEML